MKPIAFLFLLLLVICQPSLFSQTDHSEAPQEGIFAFGFDGSGQKATFFTKKSRFGYKYEVAQKVMDDLIQAKGVKNMAVPTLKMTNATRHIAYAKPSDAIIGLENKAYDICTTFGKDSLNALAALLAHELTHYYEKHDWKNQFAKDFGSVNNTGDRAAEKLDVETQADYLGGFLAYTAGYNTLGVMPRFLTKVYQEYFPQKNGILPGYPPLSERIEMATKSLKKLENLIPIFETANYLVAMKDYKSAKAYYEYILITEKYQSREIYNNLGVTAVHLAMDLFPEGVLKYLYPVTLDAQSRLLPNTKGMGDDTEEQRKMLLNEAIKYFKNAEVLDPDYALAYLNLGCAYALQGDLRKASYHAETALEMAEVKGNRKLMSDATVLLGILAARKKDAAAENLFSNALQQQNPFARLNLNILLDQPNPIPTPSRTALARTERIDQIDLDEMVNEMYLGGLTTTKEININRRTLFAEIQQENSTVLINFLPTDEAYHFFQKTKPNFTGTTNKGIQIGDAQGKVIAPDQYGAPERTFSILTGQILVYSNYQLLFFFE